MSLTVYPTITFDTSLGSDTLGSGSGGTALSGTAGAVTNTSTSATVGDAVDLSGVAVDGSAVFWIATASGRQYSRISAIAGSSGAWTLTLQDSTWTTSTGKNWGIGGKRATLDHANSRTLLADCSSGWTLTPTDGQTQTINSVLTFNNFSNSSTAVAINIRGTKTGTAPVINQTANAACFNVNNGQALTFNFEHLTLTNSNATKTSATGLIEGNGASLVVKDLTIGDASGTNNLGTGINVSAGRLTVISTTITHCATGINNSGGSTDIDIRDVQIDHCTADGINITSGGPTLHIDSSIIFANTGRGVYFSIGANTHNFAITSSTVDGNGSHGIDFAGVTVFTRLIIDGNNITGNGGYGVNATNNLDSIKTQVDYNTFGHASDADGPANTSGAYNNLTAGANDQVGVSPGYTNRAAGNFQPTSTGGAVGKGFPPSTKPIGQGGGATNTSKDCGAAQHASAGAAGMLYRTTLTGGCVG